jgi:hypothetical protein
MKASQIEMEREKKKKKKKPNQSMEYSGKLKKM